MFKCEDPNHKADPLTAPVLPAGGEFDSRQRIQVQFTARDGCERRAPHALDGSLR
jgi:hypothetical protein